MIYRTLHFTLDAGTLSVKDINGEEKKIYNKDYRVLAFLCEQRKAVTAGEILEHVWDRNEEYSSNVVASSISNIRRVLGPDSIKTVRNSYLVETLEEVSEKPQTPPRKTSKNKAFIFMSVFMITLVSGIIAYAVQSPAGNIVVTQINVNPKGNDNLVLTDEWITLRNFSDSPIQMKGYSVSDEIGHTYVFKDFILKPYGEVRLVTGKCADSDNRVCWNFTDYAIWNNDKDAIYIKDPKKRIIYRYAYDNSK